MFTDESYFETGNLRSRRARGVLRRSGEEYLSRNMNRKFPKGASVMFWGCIRYNFNGEQLPYHVYKTPYETKKEEQIALEKLWDEYKYEVREHNFLGGMGIPVGLRPLLKERDKGRKGGIDWYLYREQILLPLFHPFIELYPDTIIMEDNAPSHKSHYTISLRQKLGYVKLLWPPNSPDLNPIETIWDEMKDKIKKDLGWNFTAAGIRGVIVKHWKELTSTRINHHIMSMNVRIEACIADNGGNNFKF